VEFGVLGPLRIVDGGEALPIGGPIRRALLAYLLLHANRAVPSDELIEAIWNGRPPVTAASSLQNHVARLRRVLGADRLLTRERGYELRVEPGELDLDVVESLVDEGECLDPAPRSAKLREALRLWRGRPLAELDSFTFARVEELRLEERRLDVLEDCLDAELAAGRADGVVSELRALVSEHPLRERLRGQLMVALYVHGRQAEALDVYRVGRETLVEEAGLEPGPALRELERAILRQELPLRPPAQVADGRVRPERRAGARMRVALAALLIAGVAAALGLAVGREPEPALAGIGANSLGVIDADRNELVATIAVGQRPVSVAVGAQAVWVANAGDETVSRIDPAARELVENVRARADWGSVGVGRRAVWVVGRVGRSPTYQAAISRIDPDVAAVTGVARYSAISVRYDESFAIDEGFGAVWATAGWRLLRLDRDGRLQGTIDAFSSARGLAVGEGAVWVGDIAHPVSGNSIVSRVDPGTNRVAAKVPVAAEVASIAVGAGAVWVASDDGTLTRIDPVANVATATIDLGGALSDVAVADGAVWVANSGAPNVVRIDPGTNQVVATITTKTRPDAIAVGAGAVWVTAY
jgi:YVTN family beta-propeller protein